MVKLAFKNKMYNTIKLETKTKVFISSPKGSCSGTTIGVHYTVEGRHINFLCMFKFREAGGGGVCWVRRFMYSYGYREGRELQLPIKTTSSDQIHPDENGTIGTIIFSGI